MYRWCQREVNATKDKNISNDGASKDNNNNEEEKIEMNEAAKNSNDITMMTTMTTTTTTEMIVDKTPKSSNEFYIHSQQVMGTGDKVASVADSLPHNPAGENLNSRLYPPQLILFRKLMEKP